MASTIEHSTVDHALFAQLLTTATRLGIANAWSMYLQTMKEACAASRPVQVITLSQLHQLIRADRELAAHLDGLAPETRALLEAELNDTPSAVPKSRLLASGVVWTTVTGLTEADGSPVACLSQATFQNWGRTIDNLPALTCFPRTKAGIGKIVQWAAANDKRVRAAGYRHTWTDLYSNDGEVLISMLPLSVVNDLPASEPPIDPANELQGITITGYLDAPGGQKALCRIGAATTNEQFRRWCLSPDGGALSWTVPLNVIMVEITFGGSNAPICHGAGWRNQTLSDLVAEVEFVNVLGELQTVSDPDVLKAAAGAFGLLGVVTSLTLKLDAMTFAALQPATKRLALAVPPPTGYVVPSEINMSGITSQDLAAAEEDFISRCENDYYAEWFWFTFQQDCWINTWKNDGQRDQAVDYPSPQDVVAQELQEYLAGLLVGSSLFNCLPQSAQALLLGTSAMAFLPTTGATTPLIDALHFRRGIQNMRVLDMEFEIPIPALADDPSRPDWSVCQQAWWDAIATVYTTFRASSNVPMRLTLEMRIMGNSEVTMAPQHGNRFGTCSIEVLTTLNTDRDDWAAFMQGVADAWSQYRDASGQPLNLRPHWAKQWQGLSLRGQPIETYLPTHAYQDRLPEFRQGLLAVAQAGGYSLPDMQARFSNELIDKAFAPVFSDSNAA